MSLVPRSSFHVTCLPVMIITWYPPICDSPARLRPCMNMPKEAAPCLEQSCTRPLDDTGDGTGDHNPNWRGPADLTMIHDNIENIPLLCSSCGILRNQLRSYINQHVSLHSHNHIQPTLSLPSHFHLRRFHLGNNKSSVVYTGVLEWLLVDEHFNQLTTISWTISY